MKHGKFSAGVVVLRRDGGAWHCLLLRCYHNWDFPKGEVEPGERPLAAARREVQEEASLTALDFRWGEAYAETEPYRGGKVARYYLAESPRGGVRLPVNPELGHPEHHEYRWVSFDEARKLAPPRLQPIVGWAERIIADVPATHAALGESHNGN